MLQHGRSLFWILARLGGIMAGTAFTIHGMILAAHTHQQSHRTSSSFVR